MKSSIEASWSCGVVVRSPVRLAVYGVAAVGALFAALAVLTQVGAGYIARLHPPSGRFVEVDGGRMHLVELGDADAPPVVLLHGAGVNLNDMRLALGDRLAATHRVILIDRPGHGWSDRPGGVADASPARQALLVHQALGRIGVTRPTLVAHSWAGALATAYALACPDGVAGLVLLAPVTRPWANTAAWHDSFIKAVLAEGTRVAAVPWVGSLVAHTVSLPLGKLLMWPSVQSAFAPQAPPPDYIEKTDAELLLRPSTFTANAQDVELLDAGIAQQAKDYPRIKAPTVIVTGDRDAALSPQTHAETIAAAMPSAKLVTLPGVGHMVHFAAPERIVELIVDLTGSEPAAPGSRPGCFTAPPS
jgi:pimeloyl-ACP methyl ester carboxylesterase